MKPAPELNLSQSTKRYWDYCASTPLSSQVIQQMTESLKEDWANPTSTHAQGYAIREKIEEARSELALLFKVQARELYFTSGATESNNISILSGFKRVGSHHIISQKTEHKAVLNPIHSLLEKSCEHTLLDVNTRGEIDLDQLRDSIRPDTRLVSIMHVNNEIGTVQPLEEISKIISESAHQDCLFHVDGAQSTGKIELDLKALDIDLFSLSAHKFYGPKGVGALFINRQSKRRSERLNLPAICFGGGHERGVRPGTLATHQIIGLGQAAKEAREALAQGEPQSHQLLVQQLYEGLLDFDPTLKRLGNGGAPHILSVTVSEPLLLAIESAWNHIAFSRGSACQSSSGQASHVLSALGLSSSDMSHTLRFGFGRFTQADEIQFELERLAAYVG